MKQRVFVCILMLLGNGSVLAAPERIVSIGGAVTEILYALEVEDRIVATDTTSSHPPAAVKQPKVGYMRALSAEGVLSLAPDLVILPGEAGPPAVIDQLRQAGVDLLMVEDHYSIDGVINKIETIASALGLPQRGEALVKKLRQQLDRLEAHVSGTESHPGVLFILNHGGGAPMVAGRDTAADGIIRLSGAKNVVSDYSGYKPLTPEAAVTAAPDVLLITRQGLEQMGGRDALLSRPGLALTPAGREQRVIALDALLLLGFGPRTVDAALQLAEQYDTGDAAEADDS